MSIRTIAIGLASIVLVTVRALGEANENFSVETAGVRYGFGANNLSKNFQQIEATTDFALPMIWDLGRTWELKPRLGISLGMFGNYHESGPIGSVGPILSMAPAQSPIALDGGVRVTGLGRRDYVTRDMGSYLQFTSMIGVTWKIEERVRVSYHFQHMSNAGLAGDNQGVNMNIFSVEYCF